MKKIVVTGGAGFIGSWVVDYLLKSYGRSIKEIIVLDNLSRGSVTNIESALKDKRVRLVKGDIRKPGSVNRVVKGSDYVIHEAVIRITQCVENPRLCNEIMVDGTFNVMEACAKYGVKKLVFNSSASVYGQPLQLPMKEDDPFNNDTLYGAAKIANEEMAKAFRKMYGLNYVCLRPFNAYGPRMDIYGVYTEVLIKWLDRIDEGKPPVIFGDGTNTLDFVYVEDIARATIKALKSRVNEGFYNVGSGKEVSLNRLAKTLLKLTNSSHLGIEHKKQERKVEYATRRRAYTLNAKRDLGFVATTSLEKGLTKLIKWREEEKKKRK